MKIDFLFLELISEQAISSDLRYQSDQFPGPIILVLSVLSNGDDAWSMDNGPWTMDPWQIMVWYLNKLWHLITLYSDYKG